MRVLDPDGAEVPAHVEHDGRSVSWLARDVPSLGWRAYRLVAADDTDGLGTGVRRRRSPTSTTGWRSTRRAAAAVCVAGRRTGEATDRRRTGWATSLPSTRNTRRTRRSGEGPWHLLPKGPVVCSSEAAAEVRAYRGPLGQRLVVRGRIGTLLRYTQTLTLWRGVARVDCRTTIDEFTGADRLLRLRWPCPVPGAMPVSEVGDAVVGRGFALLH